VPLVVAGEGPDEPRLRRLSGGADVRFVGWLAPQALAEIRRGAAVVLVPSRCEEAAGYSVLDAYATGVPVLASDRGGLPELVTDGSVLGADDPDAWGRALGELWADPARRGELGERALQRARDRLGEERYYDRLIEMYSELREGEQR
jgi:glycosyltransferase involved in cell wall biosynthesis